MNTLRMKNGSRSDLYLEGNLSKYRNGIKEVLRRFRGETGVDESYSVGKSVSIGNSVLDVT